jgi:hypothetical protein
MQRLYLGGYFILETSRVSDGRYLGATFASFLGGNFLHQPVRTRKWAAFVKISSIISSTASHQRSINANIQGRKTKNPTPGSGRKIASIARYNA